MEEYLTNGGENVGADLLAVLFDISTHSIAERSDMRAP
jgi:hypothetical protein